MSMFINGRLFKETDTQNLSFFSQFVCSYQQKSQVWQQTAPSPKGAPYVSLYRQCSQVYAALLSPSAHVCTRLLYLQVSDSFIHGTILPVILLDQWEKRHFWAVIFILEAYSLMRRMLTRRETSVWQLRGPKIIWIWLQAFSDPQEL